MNASGAIMRESNPLIRAWSGGDGKPSSCLDDFRVGLLRRLAQEAPAGHFVEVGVYRGGSAWHLAEIGREQGRELHLFDTFSGMPWQQDCDIFKIGDFDKTNVEDVRRWVPDATIHVGIFPETLPPWLLGIAFAHIDCDQFQSVDACIRYLWPRMVPGAVMLFDDYPELEGARRAVERSGLELCFAPQDSATPHLHLRGRYYARKPL